MPSWSLGYLLSLYFLSKAQFFRLDPILEKLAVTVPPFFVLLHSLGCFFIVHFLCCSEVFWAWYDSSCWFFVLFLVILEFCSKSLCPCLWLQESYYIIFQKIVSVLTFRTSMHFDFSLVHVRKYESRFNLLHGDSQFSQYHLFKMLSFL